MSAPFTEACSNPGVTDRWTCPGCYADLGGIGVGDGATIHLTMRDGDEPEPEPIEKEQEALLPRTGP